MDYLEGWEFKLRTKAVFGGISIDGCQRPVMDIGTSAANCSCSTESLIRELEVFLAAKYSG